MLRQRSRDFLLVLNFFEFYTLLHIFLYNKDSIDLYDILWDSYFIAQQ